MGSSSFALCIPAIPVVLGKDWVVSLTNRTLKKVVLRAGESVFQDAKGQPMPAQRWPTEFGHVDRGWEQADTTDLACVKHVIVYAWRQCFAVSPVDVRESEDLLADEELDLVEGCMGRPLMTGQASEREQARIKPGGK